MIKDERVKYDPRRDFYGSEALNARADERVDHGGVAAALQARMDANHSNYGSDGRGDTNLQDDDLDWS